MYSFILGGLMAFTIKVVPSFVPSSLKNQGNDNTVSIVEGNSTENKKSFQKAPSSIVNAPSFTISMQTLSPFQNE